MLSFRWHANIKLAMTITSLISWTANGMPMCSLILWSVRADTLVQLLSIMENPGVWFNAPIVYIKSGQKGDTIKKILGIDKTIKKAPLVSFFDSLGNYKLATNLEKAYLATIPTQIEKDVIELDRRVNLLYSALEGKYSSNQVKVGPFYDQAQAIVKKSDDLVRYITELKARCLSTSSEGQRP